MLHQELWKERLTKFENAEIRKKLRFLFSPSVFQEKDTKEIFKNDVRSFPGMGLKFHTEDQSSCLQHSWQQLHPCPTVTEVGV